MSADISRWIAQRAEWSPAKVAVFFEERAITYADLWGVVARLAGALAGGLGVRPGDRVAHLGLNSPDFLALLFACARTGAILVPLNWRLTPAEHAAMLADAEPRAIVAEPDFQAHVDRVPGLPRTVAKVALGPAAPEGWRCRDDLLAAAHAAAPPPAGAAGAAPVLMVYTSGTTGRPRGAVLTQEALLYNALDALAAHDLTSGDHVLTCLPMFHVGGLNIQTTPALYAGATVTLMRRFDAGEALRLIGAGRPTLLLAVPTVAHAMASHPAFARTDLGSLRCLATGSTVVPEAVMRPWLERGVAVTQVYGMTESGPASIALRIEDARRKAGSCGKPLPHSEARVVDGTGRDVPRGERGEIWLRGPHMTTGYWRDPEATAAAFTDGWFRTGDVGHQDAEGYYYIDDRLTDVIISGGENVYAAELEAVLASCEAIAESAVVGRPDDRWGEVPVVCAVVRPGAALTREAVLDLFGDRLARYKHPRDVVFMAELPRTAMGKVQKFELRRRLRADPEERDPRPAAHRPDPAAHGVLADDVGGAAKRSALAIWFRALARLGVYRRLLLIERRLDQPIPDLPLPASIAMRLLGPDDIPAYLAFRPDQRAEEIAERLARGHWCLAAWRDGRVVSAAWGAPGRAPLEYLDWDLPLAPDEAYSYDLYTAPAARGRGMTPATRAPHLLLARDRGYRRLLATLLPENRRALRTPEQLGYRVIGRLGYVGVGRWRRRFCRLRPGAEPAGGPGGSGG